MPIAIDRLVRSRRKSIALIVHPDGSLEVRAPLALPEPAIREFVIRNAAWITKKKEHARRNPPPPARAFHAGETLLLHGQAYPLRIVRSQRPALQFTNGEFLLAASAMPTARQTFTRWYRAEAARHIPQRLQALAARHGFTYKKMRLSSARTRWGSCSTLGTISISWRLVMAPEAILDYVIIHELVHTRIHNHSRLFWDGVAAILPDYKTRRAWLKKNGRTLSLD